MTTGELQQSDVDTLKQRAHRRWLISMIAVAVLTGAGVAGGAIAASHSHPRRAVHHHSHVVGIAVAASVVVLTLGFLAWLVVHARRHEHSFFAPQLVVGLKYRQRKQVARDVRRGTPSSDPMLRHVETSAATRILRYRKVSMGIFLFAGAGEVFSAILRHGLAQVLYIAAAVMFAFLCAYQLRAVACARRYLTRVGQ